MEEQNVHVVGERRAAAGRGAAGARAAGRAGDVAQRCGAPPVTRCRRRSVEREAGAHRRAVRQVQSALAPGRAMRTPIVGVITADDIISMLRES